MKKHLDLVKKNEPSTSVKKVPEEPVIEPHPAEPANPLEALIGEPTRETRQHHETETPRPPSGIPIVFVILLVIVIILIGGFVYFLTLQS